MMDEQLGFSLEPQRNRRDERIKALDQLFKKSAMYGNSKEYFELLQFIGRFPQLSPFNAFLVHTQNAGVEIVMSARKWHKYQRTVRYQARPLIILVPFGPVEFVFDIADTDGPSIPERLKNPFSTAGKLEEFVYVLTKQHGQAEGIKILEQTMHKSSAGAAMRKILNFDIVINKSYGLNEKYSTLIHELAHIFCGHLGTKENMWWKDRSSFDDTTMEIEAESVTFLVCTRRGLETGSESYLSNYINQNKELPPISFDTILTVAGHIEQMGKSDFRPKNKKAD